MKVKTMDEIEENGDIIRDKDTVNERVEKKGLSIKLGVDASVLEDKMNEINNLRTENEELKEDLNIIATKELNAKAKQYGVEATLEAVRDYENLHYKAPLNDAQLGTENKEGEYETAEQAILAINEMSKTDETLHKQLGKMVKKSLKSDKFDIEFEPTLNPQTGKMSLLSAWRSPKRIGVENPNGETQEAFQKRKLAKKLEMKIKVKD